MTTIHSSKSKISLGFLALFVFSLLVPICLASSSAQIGINAASIEPMVEKNNIRVALRATIEKQNQMTVLVKVSNFSEQPVLVSPDAVEMSTQEGFIILPSNGIKSAPSSSSATWAKISKAAALIPFSDPYKLISRTQKTVEYAEKHGLFQSGEQSKLNRYKLRDVLLPPGMATHGLIIYDSSSLNAFDYNPLLRIKVMVNHEPFEFIFDSAPLKHSA